MKKTTTFSVLTSIYLMISGTALFAQPILVNTMTPFPVGTVDSVYTAPPVVAPGSGGAGVTWDLSTLAPYLQGYVSVLTPSSTPYFSTFPTTTFCAELTVGINNVYIYERLSSGKWEQLAENYYGPGTGSDYTPNPESALEFPMAYLDTLIDTFQKTGGSPNTVKIKYDGYGTLVTPWVTYTNVVRIYKYWGPGDYDYNWYTTSPNLGIVATFDAQNNVYTLIRHDTSTTTGTKIIRATNTTLYPNPFTNTATLKIEGFNTSTNTTLIITDLVGKVVRELHITGNETTIQRDGLNPGLYFYYVANNETGIAKGKFVVE